MASLRNPLCNASFTCADVWLVVTVTVTGIRPLRGSDALRGFTAHAANCGAPMQPKCHSGGEPVRLGEQCVRGGSAACYRLHCGDVALSRQLEAFLGRAG